jgi:hypothetical protein
LLFKLVKIAERNNSYITSSSDFVCMGKVNRKQYTQDLTAPAGVNRRFKNVKTSLGLVMHHAMKCG